MKIHIVGNPLLEHDSMPLKLLPELRKVFPKIIFEELDPNEELPDSDEIILIDTATGIDNVTVLDDIEKIAVEPGYSMHDFGFGTQLKLMKKLGRLKKIRIICIPQMSSYEDALRQVTAAIKAS